MKLSELNANDIKLVEQAKPLRLSEIDPAEIKKAPNSLLDKPEDIPYVNSENVGDEIPMSTGAALSFGSNDAEKRGYLRQAYPGIEIGRIKGQKTDGSADTPVVKLPNEQRYRYINKPGPSLGDIAGLAGDIPGVAASVTGGLLGVGAASVPGAAAGAAIGEAGRKLIGRELIGIPRGQSLTEDVVDVGIAGGIGGLFQGAANKVAPYAKGFLSRLSGKAAPEVVEESAKKAVKTATVPVEATAKSVAVDAPENFIEKTVSKALPPKSASELVSKYGAGSKFAEKIELPSAERLRQVEAILPDLEFKPLPPHHQMLKDKTSQSILRLRRELPDDIGQALSNYEQGMKREAQAKVGELIQGVTRRTPLSRIEAGESLLSQVKAMHETTKDALAPLFNRFDKARLPVTHVGPELQATLIRDIPKLKPYLHFEEGSRLIALKPFSPSMGITEGAYSKLKAVVQNLNNPKLGFRDLQNIREYLRQSLDPVNPKSTQVLSDFRKSMLNYMQDLMSEKGKNTQVKATFQKYAQNEQFLEQMERIMGGKVESFDQLLQANPDRVLDRIFLSSQNMDVARKLLGEQRFRPLVGDYLNGLVEKATDQGGLSANKLMSLYKQKRDIFRRALSKGESDRLEALVDYMRIIPDAPSPNPSGTGKATMILGGMKKAATGSLMDGGKDVIFGIQEALKGRNARAELDFLLGNIPPEKRIGLIQRAINVSKDPYVQRAGKGLLIQEAQQGAQNGLLQKDRR
jgi:uncharacterized protein YxeA